MNNLIELFEMEVGEKYQFENGKGTFIIEKISENKKKVGK